MGDQVSGPCHCTGTEIAATDTAVQMGKTGTNSFSPLSLTQLESSSDRHCLAIVTDDESLRESPRLRIGSDPAAFVRQFLAHRPTEITLCTFARK